MNKTVKISLIIGGSLALIGAGYLIWKKFYKKPDKNEIPPTTKEVKEKIVEIEQEQVKEKKIDQNKLQSSKAYKQLKEDIDKHYTLYADVEWYMCPTDTNIIKNCKEPCATCKTDSKFSAGATQGVWILVMSRLAEMKNKFLQNEKDADIKEIGNKLLQKFKSDTDKVFKPEFYNENTNWYAEYLKKGGTPIPKS